MIGPNAYSASFYNAPVPRIAEQQAAAATAADAADAADFSMILNGAAPAKTAFAGAAAEPKAEGPSLIGFIKGLIDVINPLQHIPVIGAIYRHITGDEISPMAHLAGDAIYGGAIGGAIALADIAYEKITGKDVGETMIATLTNSGKPETTMIARNLNEQVSPAAGGMKIADIIWDDAPTQVSLLSPTPTLLTPAGTDEKDPVPHSAPTPAPVYPAKDNAITALQAADSTIGFHRQEAPAVASRTDVPPGLIAARMMDALDKYQHMKQGPTGMIISGTY